MVEVIRRIGALSGDRRGVTAIEYAIMAGAIAVTLVLAMAQLNGGVGGMFHKAAAAFPS